MGRETFAIARDELPRTVERHIVQRTMGRVRRLRVDRHGKCITIQGYTSSYFFKQLAIQAALEVLLPAFGTDVELDIQVTVIGADVVAHAASDQATHVE
jgi:hypothetical protein